MTWVGLILGIVVLTLTTGDIVGTLVVPREVHSPLSRLVAFVVRQAMFAVCRPIHTYLRRDRILAWGGPLMLLLRLLMWVALFVIGFALILLPATGGDIGSAFDESGSSMFTLGYSPPTNTASTVIDYVAAYTGLIVVAVQIGYLPTLYSEFNRRETEVTMLVSRAGMPAWGPELLLRTRFGIADGDIHPVLNELFDRWERWSAEVAESHTTYPTLIWFRSPRGWRHWLIAQLAVLDAAAMHLSLAPSVEPRLRARLCLRMGFTTLVQIAEALRLKIDEDPDPDASISVTYEQFEAAVEQLAAVGYPMEVSAEVAWPHFRGWRVNYDSLALAIAYDIDAPPALWSGPRRWSDHQVAPFRPRNRPAVDADRRQYQQTGSAETLPLLEEPPV